MFRFDSFYSQIDLPYLAWNLQIDAKKLTLTHKLEHLIKLWIYQEQICGHLYFLMMMSALFPLENSNDDQILFKFQEFVDNS